MFNDVLREMDIDSATRDAHGAGCIECNAEGCTGCPAGALRELPRLVEHEGEYMHAGCVGKFDAHVANRCTGDVCNCDACPGLVDDLEEQATEPTKVEEYEPIASVGSRWRSMLSAAALVLLALASGVTGCTAHTTAGAPEVESVGQLAAGPSVWHAPVHETTTVPGLGIIPESSDDAPRTATSLDVLRDEAAQARSVDATAKVSHGF